MDEGQERKLVSKLQPCEKKLGERILKHVRGKKKFRKSAWIDDILLTFMGLKKKNFNLLLTFRALLEILGFATVVYN
jgi:hypothetical protein